MHLIETYVPHPGDDFNKRKQECIIFSLNPKLLCGIHHQSMFWKQNYKQVQNSFMNLSAIKQDETYSKENP